MTSTQLDRQQTEEFVLVPFHNEQTGEQDFVRTIVTPWGVWGVAQDWARALGYGTTSAMLKHVPENARGKKKMRTEGGMQNKIIISETGMNLAAMHSRTIASRKWQHWLAEEVIPEIRRTGSFKGASKTEAPSVEVAPSTEVALGTDHLAIVEQLARHALALTAQIRQESAARAAAEAKVETVTRELETLEASVDAWAAPDGTPGTLSVQEAANWLASNGIPNMGRQRLFNYLRSIGWVCANKPTPKQYAIENKFAQVHHKETKVGIFIVTLITRKGLIKLHADLSPAAGELVAA